MNAEAAVSDTAEQFAEMFASMDDAYMQARAADVKDVSQRILSILCGVVQGGIAPTCRSCWPPTTWAPSEIHPAGQVQDLGFITAGGSGSEPHRHPGPHHGHPRHRRRGRRLKLSTKRQAIADGSTGALVIDPDDDTRDRLLKKREEQQRLQRLLETLKGQPT